MAPKATKRVLSYRIPIKILQEFDSQPRIIIKKNWPGLYPIDPGVLAKLQPQLLDEILKTHDIIISPKEQF